MHSEAVAASMHSKECCGQCGVHTWCVWCVVCVVRGVWCVCAPLRGRTLEMQLLLLALVEQREQETCVPWRLQRYADICSEPRMK
jgi:hypothetical protein